MNGTEVKVGNRNEALALESFLREHGCAASIRRTGRVAGGLVPHADATRAERAAFEASLGGFEVSFYEVSR